MYTSRKGILHNKLLYRKYIKPSKQQSKENDKATEKSNVADRLPDENGITESMAKMIIEEELAHLLYFKTCLVHREKEVVKIRMEQAISFREATIRKREVKFFESFPFYVISPDLVSEMK